MTFASRTLPSPGIAAVKWSTWVVSPNGLNRSRMPPGSVTAAVAVSVPGVRLRKSASNCLAMSAAAAASNVGGSAVGGSAEGRETVNAAIRRGSATASQPTR